MARNHFRASRRSGTRSMRSLQGNERAQKIYTYHLPNGNQGQVLAPTLQDARKRLRANLGLAKLPTGTMVLAPISDLVRIFEHQWRVLGHDLPAPTREYLFAKERFQRQWRFDLSWPEWKVAVELDGAEFAGGRHTRGAGYREDCLKLNAAVELGYQVFRYPGSLLRDDPAACVLQVINVLKKKRGEA